MLFPPPERPPDFTRLLSLFRDAPKAENFLKTKARDRRFSFPKAEKLLKTQPLSESPNKNWMTYDKISMQSA